MKKIILIVVGLVIVLVVVFMAKNNYVFGPMDKGQFDREAVKLDLGNQGLTQIPSYVFNLKNLEELNVSNNSLTGAIRSQIGQLVNLKILDASNNLMTGVPAEVGQLKKLEVLNLSNNRLTGLPNELGNLSSLKSFNISGNQYSQQDLDYIKSKLPSTVNIIVK